MGRFRSGLSLVVAVASLWSIAACGGHRPPGQSPFPAKIILTPNPTTSIVAGSTFNFVASAQNDSNSNVSATFTYDSNDTSVLNVAPNGVACAGVWDSAFTTCTPAGIGVALVTASAFGASSAPTYVFVHPPIDSIKVTAILLDNVPIQEPCLSQGQSMTVQAQAFSRGVDVTSSVGPFTWSANNSSVVKLTPINNSNYNFPTNQATAAADTPGITQIYASAGGVSSTSFQQPLQNGIPFVLDFFETCLIQNITLELGVPGSGQTSFAAAKGASGETVVATITDVMGNSSLPNSNNGVVLSKVPLTWSASQPAVIAASAGCTQSCTLTVPGPGAGAVTASCSPPTCNVGFPEIPASLANPQCATYFPPSCQQYIPVPVYASPLAKHTTAAISGVISGTPAPGSVLATSLGCANEPPSICSVGLFSFASGKPQTGSATAGPVAPSSLRFDLVGDKVYMGSNFGAQIVNPTNLGTANNAFTPLSTVTGQVLAVSPNGNLAIFSDTMHSPNQVYVVNTINSTAPAITPLNISFASVAGFSPDNLKAFIFGLDNNNSPNLYVYSAQQALQVIPLPPQTSVNAITFSTNSAFAYVAEPSLGGAGPAVAVFNTCDNSQFTDTNTGNSFIPLTASPVAFKALPDGQHFVALESNGSMDYIIASITPVPAATPNKPATSLCPMTVGHTVQNLKLNLGNTHPLNFFVSPDGTLVYVLDRDLNSVLVFDFATQSIVGGIQLASTAGGVNPSPLGGDISVDAESIFVAGSDGYLHQISTGVGGSDMVQSQFPDLPNYTNPFCTATPQTGACILDFVAAKP